MKLFITSFLLILFAGCTKDVYDPSDKIPGEGPNPFSKVTVASDFDWSMIQTSRLTVRSFDPYDGAYNYLVEVFDKSPEDPEANLLATGVCSKKTLFDKKIIYPKGEPGQVYVQLTTPTGYRATAPVALTPGNDNVCAFDSLAVSRETTATPVSRTPTRSVSSTYTFIVEDSFPYYGDYDFNDVVIKVQLETSMKEDYVQSANIKLTFRALGGSKRSGAFIHFPGMTPEEIREAELNGWRTTPETETETPIYVLSDDIHGLFFFHEMINTDNDLPYRGTQERLITFSFAAGAVKDLTIDDIDLFTTVLKREGDVLRTEIHQRDYSYTPKGVKYRSYSNDNCVWALMIPGDFKYPVEQVFIGDAYPDILKWVSGGSEHVQWYKSQNTVDKWIYARE
ncbi:LruC domain-containing protein [Parabacteroides sp. ZJ-118]|uniref:LruC domain-containing protein n=1 Tax=Parabacteroides sp. ZJ-118 TaxID=2709398 RepID=UPI001F149EBF|nr:LruC domain-containing protein [Parabacteroides sp. ZJ-118]